MFNLIRLLAAGSAFIAVSACTFDHASFDANQSAKADRALARGPDLADAHTDELSGEGAATRGDWKMALAFSERSYRQTPDLINEFNLATAYGNTGSNASAIPLYIDLVERGQNTLTHSLMNSDGTKPRPMLLTISMESARRLGTMNLNATQRAIVASASAPNGDADFRSVVARKGDDQGFGNN